MAKYLDQAKGTPQPSVTPQDVENKMMAGTRDDQVARPRIPTPQTTLALASQLGVDLAHVEPTGADGTQITDEDVRKAADDNSKKLPSEGQINDLTGRAKRDAARRDADRGRTTNTANTSAQPGRGPASNPAGAAPAGTPPRSPNPGGNAGTPNT